MEAEIKKAISNYAKLNGIRLTGNVYNTYSMLKYPVPNFPEAKMFKSSNIRGEVDKKNIIIIATSTNIKHFTTDTVLERPLSSNNSHLVGALRSSSHTYEIGMSF